MPARRSTLPGSGALPALLVALLLAAPAPAGAAATLTYPANGQTVTLDAHAEFSFQWSLPSNELYPEVWVGDSPTYDSDTLSPFAPICGGAIDVATSCAPQEPLAAGAHYAMVLTAAPDDSTSYTSPVSGFIVPTFLAFGCSPLSDGDCSEPRGPVAHYVADPSSGPPYSSIAVSAWLNEPDGTPVRITFTARHDGTVWMRVPETVTTTDDEVEAGIVLYRTKMRWGTPQQTRRWRPIRTDVKMPVTITMTFGGHTLTTTSWLRQPGSVAVAPRRR